MNYQSSTEKHRDHYKNRFHVQRQTIMTNCCFVQEKCSSGKSKLSYSSNISKSIFDLLEKSNTAEKQLFFLQKYKYRTEKLFTKGFMEHLETSRASKL